jgi:hypothetical protein
MIAHRPQTIAIADRVVKLEGGKFVEVSKAGNPKLSESNVLPFPSLNDMLLLDDVFVAAIGGGSGDQMDSCVTNGNSFGGE